MKNTNRERWHLEKVGFLGTVFTTLCCLGFGPLVALLAALGAGFLINDAILAPLMVAALVIGGIGLSFSFKNHRKPLPLIIHIAAGLIIVFFTFFKFISPLVWLGIGLLLVAAGYNFLLKRG